MEKKKLIPLSMMLLCSLCFSACKTSTVESNIIAKVGDKTIFADDIYSEFLSDEDTAAYIYDKLEKALIESAIPVTNSMRAKVENEVEIWQNEIRENSNLNGTDYNEDLKTALEEEEVNSVDELIAKKIYNLQYTYAKDKFLEDVGETYRKAFIDANYLYHVSDIQLSVSSSSTNTDLYNLTLSQDEAKEIYGAFKELVEVEPFDSIAKRYSKGPNATTGGDLGIVTLNDTDITNELRYALIGYSSIIEKKYDSFNLPTNKYSMALTNFYNSGMQAIPYSYIKSFNDEQEGNDGTKYYQSNTSFYYSSGGNSVSSSSKVYYRNIVFNSLLNTKTPKFITVSQEDVDNGAAAVEMDVLMPNINTHGYSNETSRQYVLVNDVGNPYVVFKDSKGLHILSINKTPFYEKIYDYYATEKNLEDDFVNYIEFGSVINEEERTNEVKALAERYITRDFGNNTADEKLLSFAMFKYYSQKDNIGDFKIVDEKVKKMIDQYMTISAINGDERVKIDYESYYDTYSNLVWFRNQDFIVKEVPLLVCLTKVSDGNYGCTYTYGKGFEEYTPPVEDDDGGSSSLEGDH